MFPTSSMIRSRLPRCHLPSCTITLEYAHRRNLSSSMARLTSSSVAVTEEDSESVFWLSEYCKKKPSPTSFEKLVKTGRGDFLGKSFPEASLRGRLGQRLANERILMQFASYLREEIPIRLAHRIQDLDCVPIMRDMEAVKAVKKLYIESFLELLDAPQIISPTEEQEFAKLLEELYKKHANVLVQMAKGAYELREAVRSGQIQGKNCTGDLDGDSIVDFESMDVCHRFLDRFYMSRIGIRVLVGQYVAMRAYPNAVDYVGMICQKTMTSAIVRKAVDDATLMCQRKYQRAPRVILEGRLDLTFPYIPTYLHYILLELLKNALRATAETHADKEELPPVNVIIGDGSENEDVVIKIMDEGGGIPRSQVDKIWSYLFTTADPSIQEAFIAAKDHCKDSPIAGLGYGLPIARSYCRYFGGDIQLMSMEGYGTDAFVYLKRLGDSVEPVPL